MSLTDDDLAALIVGGEGDRVEFKEALSGAASERIAEAICAFANDLPDHRSPGVVVVGLRDDGSPTGRPVTEEILRQLSELRTDGRIIPPPSLTVERRHCKGADLAVVTVQPSDSPPVRFRGRTWIRTGNRRDIATPQDERRLNEKRRSGDRPFDINPVPSSTLDDLSLRVFEEEYLPAAIAPDLLAANDRKIEERLAASKMIVSPDDPTPTVLGHLVLGIRTTDFLPGAYVQFVRFAGSTDADPIRDALRIDGPVAQVLVRLEEKLLVHNTASVDFSGDRERRTADYPMTALQQFTRNAVMHRTYEATHAPVRVSWYADRIEIFSPGGLFGQVTQETLGRPGVVDYRNPNLAGALRVFGFVQNFGVGIPTARRALDEAGLPAPIFDSAANFIAVRIGRRS